MRPSFGDHARATCSASLFLLTRLFRTPWRSDPSPTAVGHAPSSLSLPYWPCCTHHIGTGSCEFSLPSSCQCISFSLWSHGAKARRGIQLSCPRPRSTVVRGLLGFRSSGRTGRALSAVNGDTGTDEVVHSKVKARLTVLTGAAKEHDRSI